MSKHLNVYKHNQILDKTFDTNSHILKSGIFFMKDEDPFEPKPFNALKEKIKAPRKN